MCRVGVLGFLLLMVSGCFLPTGSGSREVESSPHTLVARVDPSEGMRRSDKFLSIENQPGELIWLRGASLQTIADSSLPRPLLSRASVVLQNPLRYLQLHGLQQNPQGILFRFSPGVEEVRLPPGFAIPINSNEPLLLGTESQCQDDPAEPSQVNFSLKLDYVHQRGLQETFTPLYCLQLNSLITVGEQPAYFGLPEADPARHGSGCPVLTPATSERFQDGHGGVFADRWLLPPGAQENRTLVTRILALQRDTRIHHASGHLSPLGTTLELYDFTARESLIKLNKKPGVEGLEQFQSTQGVELKREHEYQLVAVFDNSTETVQQASAQMALYIEPPEFELPEP